MIFAIKPFEIHDGDGIRTTLFFKGCPLRCKWCHNPESFESKKQMLYNADKCVNCMKCTNLCDANSFLQDGHIFDREKCNLCGSCVEVCDAKAFEISGKEMSETELAKELLKDEMFMKGSGGGVTFSGGEPLVQVDLCVEIAKLLKQHDINIAIDTSAYTTKEAIDRIVPYTDKFLIDIKAIDENVHKECTGVSNKVILDNIKYIDSLGKAIEIRYPYVPQFNDGEVEKIAEFVKRLKNVTCLRILPYHNYAMGKYTSLGMQYSLSYVETPSKETVLKVVETMKKYGVDAQIY